MTVSASADGAKITAALASAAASTSFFMAKLTGMSDRFAGKSPDSSLRLLHQGRDPGRRLINRPISVPAHLGLMSERNEQGPTVESSCSAARFSLPARLHSLRF